MNIQRIRGVNIKTHRTDGLCIDARSPLLSQRQPSAPATMGEADPIGEQGTVQCQRLAEARLDRREHHGACGNVRSRGSRAGAEPR
jgi:hypothetical protein